MKQDSTIKEIEGVDRIEGNKIILHDSSPMKHRVLKVVEIISGGKRHRRKIIKTKNGRYLFN